MERHLKGTRPSRGGERSQAELEPWSGKAPNMSDMLLMGNRSNVGPMSCGIGSGDPSKDRGRKRMEETLRTCFLF